MLFYQSNTDFVERQIMKKYKNKNKEQIIFLFQFYVLIFKNIMWGFGYNEPDNLKKYD